MNSVLIALGSNAAGKLAYIRGGTYRSTAGNNAGTHFLLENLNGTSTNPIRIWAYPGERPIFNLDDITPTADYPFGMVLSTSSYVHLKGFTVKNLKQVATGVGVSRGFLLQNSHHCTIEFFDIFNIGGGGLAISGSNNNHLLNVDSHHNGDGLTVQTGNVPDPWNFSDGFQCGGGDTSSDNVYEGCRTWLNSDDGWDFFDWAGSRTTIKNCWAFWVGFKPWGPTNRQPVEAQMTPNDPSVFFNNANYVVAAGAGEGFKLGGYGGFGPTGAPTTVKKFLSNCLSFENAGTGYSANMDAVHSHQMQIINSAAYGNANDGFAFGTGRSTNIAMIFKNDWAWNNNRGSSGADWVYDGLSPNIDHNYWDTTYQGINYGNLKPPLVITTVDFISVSSAGVAGPRQADGSLPNLTFLKLAQGSDLINAGADAGMPFNGSAPDLGPYEF